MTTPNEALLQALDAFLDSREFYELMQDYRHCPIDAAKPFEAVRSALQAAIAQPEQTTAQPKSQSLECARCQSPYRLSNGSGQCACGSTVFIYQWIESKA